MNYYRRYVGDYLRDTSRLSLVEHGAYTLLLDYYYAEERPIPGDVDAACRLVRAVTEGERLAVAIQILAADFDAGLAARQARSAHNERNSDRIRGSVDRVALVLCKECQRRRIKAAAPTRTARTTHRKTR